MMMNWPENICQHGVNRSQTRCGACDPFPFGRNTTLQGTNQQHLEAKLDAIYTKLEQIERLLTGDPAP